MTAFRLTPDALADLDDIWVFIAKDKQKSAEKVEREILEACSKLARFPLQGGIRTDITNLPVRFWTVPRYPNYVIVYRPETQPLETVRVLHGKRDLKRVLEEPSPLP